MIYVYLMSVILTLLMLIYDKDLEMNLLNSFLFGNEFIKQNKYLMYVIYSILSPLVLIQILIIKIKTNKMIDFMKYLKMLVIITIIGFVGYSLVSNEISYYNQSVGIEQKFKQKLNERLVILDRVTKIVHQKLDLAHMNDSSYYRNLYVVATSRADNKNLFMKWVQESNPNANYNEVSSLYKDVSASIDNNRDELLKVELDLQTLTTNYSLLNTQVPSCFYLWFRTKTLNYIPISTSANKIVNETGVDEQIKL